MNEEYDTDAKYGSSENTQGIWYLSKLANYQINNMKVKIDEVMIDNQKVQMQIDTGADISVISTRIWKRLGSPKLQNYGTKLEGYDGHIMATRSKMSSVIKHNGKFILGDIVVVESAKPFGLLGRNFLTDEIPQQLNIHSNKQSQQLPTIKGVKATVELADNARPQYCRARPVPLALEDQVEKELCRLENLGIITPISGGVDNCSPVVWVRKSNNELRLCADFKVHMNKKIKTLSYPIPAIETIFSKLKNAKTFAKIDLRSAYWQIELDDHAKELSVINTSKGLYRINRLQMGMKNASSIFQRTMESILADIKGVLIYQDDVAIFAENKVTLAKRLKTVRTRLAEKHVTVNEEKSISYCEELQFLGFKISARGIEPDDRLVRKIRDISQPKSMKELEYFVGLLNYFGRLIPNFSKKIQPLNAIRRQKIFKWTIECTNAFDHLKKIISSAPIVQPYSLEKEVTLTTDASMTAF